MTVSAPGVRGIDHAVIAGRDLGDLADAFAQLGFTVGPPNRHPWGSENRLIALGRSYLELIAPGVGFRSAAVGGIGGYFPRALGAALDRGAGLAMLALRTEDASADARRFAAARLGPNAPFSFERDGTDADGVVQRFGFALAFARSPLAPDLDLFTCELRGQAGPDGAATHANEATVVLGVVAVAENPSQHAEALSLVTGQREMLATSMGIEIGLADGQRLDVLTPPALAFQLGAKAEIRATAPRFVALRIGTPDLASTRRFLEERAIACTPVPNGLVVSAPLAHPVAVCFEPLARQP